MEKLYFSEEQFFTQLWIWLLLIAAMSAMLIPTAIGLYTQLVLDQPWGNRPIGNVAFLWVAGLELLFAVGLFLFMAKMRLIVKVSDTALHFRYPPLIMKERIISRESVKAFGIRQYKPLKEYGGWGIKYGMGRVGKAYNVKGNIGMQLELKNGQKVLFGTQRADAFQRAMEKMMKQ